MNIEISSIKNCPNEQVLIDQILEVESAVWENPDWRVSREKLTKRIATYPEGFVIISVDGIVAAFSSSMRTTFDIRQKNSWFSITDSGNLGTHNLAGDTLWIVSMTVHPKYQSMGLGGKMLDFHWDNAKKIGVKLMVGTTPSGYHNQNQEISIDEYLNLQTNGFSIDKKVRFYQKNGFNIVQLVPDYMPDPDSNGWGCILEKN